uniref:Sorting nexin 2A-like isoform X1 n=1 Tax=Rhizophora mucronata TaxID=61149 RepID=A0A2P2L3G5_RHIMU
MKALSMKSTAWISQVNLPILPSRSRGRRPPAAPSISESRSQIHRRSKKLLIRWFQEATLTLRILSQRERTYRSLTERNLVCGGDLETWLLCQNDWRSHTEGFLSRRGRIRMLWRAR